MEVQVWASLTKRQHSESPRPSAEDTLLGSAYIPLNDIIISEDLGGDFPLFKAGVDRLGGQSLHVAIRRTVLPSEGAPLRPVDARVNCMEILVCLLFVL